MDDLVGLIWIAILIVSLLYTALRQRGGRARDQSSTLGRMTSLESIGSSIRRLAQAQPPGRPEDEPPRQVTRSAARAERRSQPPALSREEAVWAARPREETATTRPPARRPPVLSILSTRAGLHQAILMQEILGRPKGLRDDRFGGGDRAADGP